MEKQQFDANPMIDAVRARLGSKNDAALCRQLDILPPVLSKLRHGRLPVGPTMLIHLHEITGYSIKELRGLMGDTQGLYRCGRGA